MTISGTFSKKKVAIFFLLLSQNASAFLPLNSRCSENPTSICKSWRLVDRRCVANDSPMGLTPAEGNEKAAILPTTSQYLIDLHVNPGGDVRKILKIPTCPALPNESSKSDDPLLDVIYALDTKKNTDLNLANGEAAGLEKGTFKINEILGHNSYPRLEKCDSKLLENFKQRFLSNATFDEEIQREYAFQMNSSHLSLRYLDKEVCKKDGFNIVELYFQARETLDKN